MRRTIPVAVVDESPASRIDESGSLDADVLLDAVDHMLRRNCCRRHFFGGCERRRGCGCGKRGKLASGKVSHGIDES